MKSASDEASKNYQGFSDQAQSITLPAREGGEAADKSIKDEGSAPVQVPESLSADIVKEANSMFAQFRLGASERLRQVQKAEDAADEALLQFGTNIRNFLRDAVTVTAPDDGSKNGVLFESRDSEGKRVVHATRFDAQLHVIHSNLSSFTQDPESDEWAKWKETFDAEKKTEDIATDLKKYDELRRAMEKLVPEQVEYAEFWRRYYFLRHVIETEEQKRRELLRGTQAVQEEVGWGDEDEEEETTTPNNGKTDADQADPTATPKPSDNGLLKPREGRRSNEHSVAGSDASYDIVSGATSRGPGSPKEVAAEKTAPVTEESDEEDWE